MSPLWLLPAALIVILSGAAGLIIGKRSARRRPAEPAQQHPEAFANQGVVPVLPPHLFDDPFHSQPLPIHVDQDTPVGSMIIEYELPPPDNNHEIEVRGRRVRFDRAADRWEQFNSARGRWELRH